MQDYIWDLVDITGGFEADVDDEPRELLKVFEALADDIQLYFGLGCRNVTQVLVPETYDFVPLLTALRKYDHYRDHEKYRNNFDYQLTIAIMNNRFYMSNDSIVLLENEADVLGPEVRQLVVVEFGDLGVGDDDLALVLDAGRQFGGEAEAGGHQACEYCWDYEVLHGRSLMSVVSAMDA